MIQAPTELEGPAERLQFESNRFNVQFACVLEPLSAEVLHSVQLACYLARRSKPARTVTQQGHTSDRGAATNTLQCCLQVTVDSSEKRTTAMSIQWTTMNTLNIQ